MTKKLGETIKKIRKKRGLTLDQLSAMCQLPVGEIHKIESGEKTELRNIFIIMDELKEDSAEIAWAAKSIKTWESVL
jgi:transcriptional regulator with XRE-family HTH domain